MEVPIYALRIFVLTIMVIGVSAEVTEDYSTWDPAYDNVLFYWNNTQSPGPTLTTSSGAPVGVADTTSLNKNLINNKIFLDMITHIVRERTNERVAHAKGAGAFGVFEVLNDFSHICKADFFKLGKKTPVAVRFSMTTGERGLPDLRRNFRGFSTKFYTEEGNFDIAGFNTPMYFYKDPIKFVAFSHAARRNPSTNLYDANTMWDLIANNPESLPCFMLAFAGFGYPAQYANMPGFSIHRYQVENLLGELSAVNFHFIPEAGIENMDLETIKNNSASYLDYLNAGLYRSIYLGNYPCWTVYLQVISEKELRENPDEIFDVTKYLDKKKYPLQKFGKLTLNRNPTNFHAEIEQLAFMPGNTVPGIRGSPGKLFESRVMAYRDAQMYRLGTNVNKIAVNCPFQATTNTFNRDGLPPVKNNEGAMPNYADSTFNGPVADPTLNMKELIEYIESPANNTEQATKLYTEELTEEQRQFLVQSLITSLTDVHSAKIRQKAIDEFTKVHPDLGLQVSQGLGG